MYKHKRISARMRFISITKWNKIKKREKIWPFAIDSPWGQPVGKPIFSSRVLTRCAFILHPSCRPSSDVLSLTYEGYTKSLSRWNSKGRTPTLGFYLVSRRAWSSPDGGDETKRDTNTHTSLDWFSALSTRNTVGFMRYHITSISQCYKKDL